MPQPEKNRCATVEGIDLSAIYDYTLTSPSRRSVSDRWIEVTGSEKQEYGLFFLSGIPSEVNLRQDKDTLVRFGLKKKEPNQTLEPNGPERPWLILNVGQRKMKPAAIQLRSSELW